MYFSDAIAADCKLDPANVQSPPAIVDRSGLERTTFDPAVRGQLISDERVASDSTKWPVVTTTPLATTEMIATFFSGPRSWEDEQNHEPMHNYASPLPDDAPNQAINGGIIGRHRRIYPPGTPLNQIPWEIPRGHYTNTGTPIVYVNGITTSLGQSHLNVHQIANSYNKPAIGIYNASEGPEADVRESIKDKFNLGSNPVVDELRSRIVASLERGESMHLIAVSQGAIVASRAIGDIRRELLTKLSPPEVDRLLGTLKIETFGGASFTYPDGPRYVHYINDLDPIALNFGLTTHFLTANEIEVLRPRMSIPEDFSGWLKAYNFLDVTTFADTHPGRDARIIRFSHPAKENWCDAHHLDTYLQYRQDSEMAYSGPIAVSAPTDYLNLFLVNAKWLGIVSSLLIASAYTMKATVWVVENLLSASLYVAKGTADLAGRFAGLINRAVFSANKSEPGNSITAPTAVNS